MSNRTREIFDFAQMEPIAFRDIAMMLRECDEEELDHVEDVMNGLVESFALMSHPESEFAEML